MSNETISNICEYGIENFTDDSCNYECLCDNVPSEDLPCIDVGKTFPCLDAGSECFCIFLEETEGLLYDYKFSV